MVRVLVAGGRDFRDADRAYKVLDTLHESTPITLIIEGGARGADHYGMTWAVDRQIPRLRFNAEWGTYGGSAGPIRNSRMLEEGKPDVAVIFPGGTGTADMTIKLMKAKIPIIYG